MTTPNLLYLREGKITTSVHGGKGDGGNIKIEQPVFLVLYGAEISAQADEGQGGNITIFSDSILFSFVTNYSKVRGEALDKCQEMADVIKSVLRMKGLEQSLIRIEGHTDSRGRASYNENLSERRAKSVKNVLVNMFGVPAHRLEVTGWGEWKPLASNNTKHGRFLNRRVTLVRVDR